MKADKRELILEAAAQIFGEKGFHSATVEEIAKEAGVGKGTIYQYFDSKSEIFNELHRWFIQRYITALDILDENEPFLTNLDQLITIHIAHMREFSPIATKIHRELAEVNVDKCEMGGMLQQLQKRFSRLINGAMARGELKVVDPYLAVNYIAGALFAVTHAMFLGTSEQERCAEQIVDLIMNGLVPREATSSSKE